MNANIGQANVNIVADDSALKFTAAGLAAMSKADLFKLASKLGLQTTVLVKIRSGVPHKRISAGRDQLIQTILASQGN